MISIINKENGFRLIRTVCLVAACSVFVGWWRNDIALVREGVLPRISDAISISDALESYPRCEKMRWDKIKTSHNEIIVQFSCDRTHAERAVLAELAATFPELQELGQVFQQRADLLKSATLYAQFSISKDGESFSHRSSSLKHVFTDTEKVFRTDVALSDLYPPLRDGDDYAPISQYEKALAVIRVVHSSVPAREVVPALIGYTGMIVALNELFAESKLMPEDVLPPLNQIAYTELLARFIREANKAGESKRGVTR